MVNFSKKINNYGISTVPLVPQEKPQKVIITDVKVDEDYEFKSGKNKGEKTNRFIIQYMDPEKERVYAATEYDIELSNNPEQSWEITKTRFLNVYEACTGSAPDDSLFDKVEDCLTAFKVMADTLNGVATKKTEKDAPLYLNEDGSNKEFWFVVFYNDRGNLQTPVNRFIQQVQEGKDALISVPNGVLLEKPSRNSNTGVPPVGTNQDPFAVNQGDNSFPTPGGFETLS